MKTFISFPEAQQAVLASAPLMPSESLALGPRADARTLAAPIDSRERIPPFDNSAMDGFAVRAADLSAAPASLKVEGEVPAGTAPERPVTPGTCLRIMTGAPIPEGADAVVPVEQTTEAEGQVQFEQAPEVGAHIRRAGEDVQEGQELVAAGTVVTPPVIGMAASLGHAQLQVRRRPQVAVVATGSELVPPSATPGPGQIRNANGPALAAQVRGAGGEALPPQTAGDDRGAVRRTFEEALDRGADVLLVSGGMSMGDYDFVRDVLEAMGTAWHFWKVRQRPGKPLGFGLLGETLVFGLPGNPVSAAMCFEQYARPALATMLGRSPVRRPRHAATLTEAMRVKEGLHYFARGVAETGADGCLTVRPTGAQGSHVYSSVVAANCIIHFPEEGAHPPAGTPVQIEWLDW